MFADDAVSCSDTVVNLQQQINYIEDYCKSVKMKINLEVAVF
jgi:hypothetical protein